MGERLDKYGFFMKDIADRSGEVIRGGFGQVFEVAIKDDMTPVTPIDRIVDYMVANGVKESFPGHGYLGEEVGGRLNSRHVWLCDPLDGTRPYINGIPTVAFALSLIEDGEVVSSIIQDPITHRSVISAKGEGAWMNGHKLQVSDRDTLDNANIHTSWGSEGYLTRLAAIRKLGAKVIKVDATAYMGMLVAMGKMDADMFTGNQPWDIAAQALAVTEAGGRATTMNGDKVRITESIDGLIVSNGLIHDKLVDIVQLSRKTPDES